MSDDVDVSSTTDRISFYIMLMTPFFAATARTMSSMPHACWIWRWFGKNPVSGLAYTTVTALMLNAAIRLYSMTPTKLENVPHEEAAKAVKFVSQLWVSVSFNIICQVKIQSQFSGTNLF